LEAENREFKQKNKESVAAKKLQKLQELNNQKSALASDFRAIESEWQANVRNIDGKILESKRIIENLERTIQLKTSDALISYQTEVKDTCAVCSQKLPAESIEHVKAKKKENYEAALESVKALENDLAKEKEHLNELTKQIDLLPEKPTFDKTESDRLDSAIFTLQQEIAGFDVNADMPNFLERAKAIEVERDKYADIRRTIQLNDECEAKIKELEEQNAKDAQEKSALQQKIDSVGEFIKMKCELAQEAVQKHFEGTGLSFDLFRFIKSTGEVKECCNILLNGTPYNDLSYSTKYIASLYIVEAFQRAYGVSLPIISDNTESIDYEGYAQSANAESQTILMFRVEENCPKCGGHSGRRALNGTWTCQKCGNVWRKSVTIDADNKH
jgi:hypothetical protein